MLQQNLYVAAKHWRKILQSNFMLQQNPKPIIRFASSFLSKNHCFLSIFVQNNITKILHF